MPWAGFPSANCAISQALSTRSVRALEEAGLLEGSEEEIFRRPSYRVGSRSKLPDLNAEQQARIRHKGSGGRNKP